jgi:hypothetical protein
MRFVWGLLQSDIGATLQRSGTKPSITKIDIRPFQSALISTLMDREQALKGFLSEAILSCILMSPREAFRRDCSIIRTNIHNCRP